MSQDLIKEKFIKYLDLIEPELIKALESEFSHPAQRIADLKNYLNEVREYLEKGYCFGFSVVHGAMDSVGKINWWEEVLVNIANWDETPEQLDQSVLLSDSDENARWQTCKNTKENVNNYLANFLAEKNEKGISLLHSIAANKITQPYLIRALKLFVPQKQNDMAPHDASTQLTRTQFFHAVKNYALYKNRYAFFSPFKWRNASEESFSFMLKMNSALDDQTRFRLAQQYISHYPDKAFATELNKVIRMN